MGLIDFVLLLVIASGFGVVGRALTGEWRGALVFACLSLSGALMVTLVARGLGLPEVLVVRLGDAELPILWSVGGAAASAALLALLDRRTLRLAQ